MKPLYAFALTATLALSPCAQGQIVQNPLSVLQAQSGALVAQNLRIASQAASRHLMTAGFPGPFVFYPTNNNTGQLYTLQYILPLEGAVQAIRIGVANGYNQTAAFNSMSVWSTDSYSGAIIPGGAWRGENGNNLTTIPTANSVYQTGTMTNGAATITGLTTGSLPSGTTMYVIGPNGTPVNATATVTNGTTVTMSANFTGTTGSYTVQFANLGTECQIFWDNKGVNSSNINTSGTTRSFTIPPNTAVSTGFSSPIVATEQWSDLVPCQSVARADGGTRPLFAVYLTHAASGNSFNTATSANFTQYNATVAPILSNRYIFYGRPWNNGGTDYADNPAGTGFTTYSLPIHMTIQYVTDAPGRNVVQVGDSIAEAPTNDYISSPIMRACYLISTPQSPCEWSSFAWGGTGQSIYLGSFLANINSFYPSAVVAQPITRNDGIVPPTLAGVQARAALYTDLASRIPGGNIALGMYGAFPLTTTLDVSTTNQNIINTIKNRLATISTTGSPSTGGSLMPNVSILDPIALLTRQPYNGNWWQFAAMNFTATSAVAAGSTSVPISTTYAPCYAGDKVVDITTGAALSGTAAVASSTNSAVVLTSGSVVGSGILSGDILTCSVSGWTGSGLGYSDDNQHMNFTGVAAIQTISTAFLKSLLGYK